MNFMSLYYTMSETQYHGTMVGKVAFSVTSISAYVVALGMFAL